MKKQFKFSGNASMNHFDNTDKYINSVEITDKQPIAGTRFSENRRRFERQMNESSVKSYVVHNATAFDNQLERFLSKHGIQFDGNSNLGDAVMFSGDSSELAKVIKFLQSIDVDKNAYILSGGVLVYDSQREGDVDEPTSRRNWRLGLESTVRTRGYRGRLIGESRYVDSYKSYFEKSGHTTKVEKVGIYTVLVVNTKTGGFGVYAFGPNAKRPKLAKSLASQADVDAFLQKLQSADDDKRAARDKGRQAASDYGSVIYVGDIFYSSWGYDQTNVDFYEVVEKKSNSTVVCRQLKKKIDHSSSGGADYVVPVDGADRFASDPVNCRVNKYGTISLRGFGGDEIGYLWDGKPKYETALGWGH